MGKASFMELQIPKVVFKYISPVMTSVPGKTRVIQTPYLKSYSTLVTLLELRVFVFRTQMGEISIHAEELTVLSKSLKPLPVVKVKDGCV